MSGSLSSLKGGGVKCPAPMTRTQLLALRASSGLNTQCTYTITDFVQGNFAAGTTITLKAVAPNELSQDVTLNSLFDNEGWVAQYNIDSNNLMEVSDNLYNVVRSPVAGRVASFDWGNPNYTYNNIDGQFFLTVGAARVVSNNTWGKESTVNMTGWVSGTMTGSRIDGAITLTGATANIYSTELQHGCVVDFTNYTGGGNTLYRSFVDAGSTVSFVGTTVSCQIQNSKVTSGAFVQALSTTVAGATLQIGSSTISNAAGILHNAAQNLLSITGTTVTSSSTRITHVRGQLSITGGQIGPYGRMLWDGTTGVVGNATMNYNVIDNVGYVRHLGTGTLSATGNRISEQSYFSTVVGSNSNATVNYNQIAATSYATISAGSTAGTFSASGNRLSGNGFIAKGGQGNLTVNYCELSASGRVEQQSANNRGALVQFSRCQGVGRIQLNAPSPSNVTDLVQYSEVSSYAIMQINAIGATPNQVSYSQLRGLTASMSIAGATSGANITRITQDNSSSAFTNNTGQVVVIDVSLLANGSLAVTGCTANQNIYYSTVQSYARWNVTNKTVIGTMQGNTIASQATFNITGTATNSYYNDIANQCIVNQNGGSMTNLFKRLGGTLTTGAFNHNNIAHVNNATKTLTANNTNRADYLGLLSTSPLV